MGGRKRVMQRLIAILIGVELNHRKIRHPEQIEGIGGDQP